MRHKHWVSRQLAKWIGAGLSTQRIQYSCTCGRAHFWHSLAINSSFLGKNANTNATACHITKPHPLVPTSFSRPHPPPYHSLSFDWHLHFIILCSNPRRMVSTELTQRWPQHSSSVGLRRHSAKSNASLKTKWQKMPQNLPWHKSCCAQHWRTGQQTLLTGWRCTLCSDNDTISVTRLATRYLQGSCESKVANVPLS